MTRRSLVTSLAAIAAFAGLGGAALWGTARWSVPAADLPPYRYEAGAEAPSEAAVKLAELVPGAVASSLELRTTEPDRAVATAEIVTMTDGAEVIVGWRSRAPEPVLRSDVSAQEELALASALRKHLPEGSTVIAMPALSERLAHFIPAEFPLAGAAAQAALRLPAPWTGTEAAVTRTEARWHAEPAASRVAGEPGEAFTVLIDALLAEDIYGAARLRALGGARPGYVIVHVRDIFDIGLNAPDRIHVGQRDFPAAGIAHDKSRAVKDWVAAEGHAAYAVERRGGDTIRAYVLSDARDKSTLLGQLLPFDSAAIGQVPGTRLVYQTGGYWVYRLEPTTAGL